MPSTVKDRKIFVLGDTFTESLLHSYHRNVDHEANLPRPASQQKYLQNCFTQTRLPIGMIELENYLVHIEDYFCKINQLKPVH